jgi:hypothetical protein
LCDRREVTAWAKEWRAAKPWRWGGRPGTPEVHAQMLSMRECKGRNGRASALALSRIVVVLDDHQRGMRSTYLTARPSASILVWCPRSRGDAYARVVSDASNASSNRGTANCVFLNFPLITSPPATVTRWRRERRYLEHAVPPRRMPIRGAGSAQ